MLIDAPGHLCPPFGKTGQIFSDLIATLLRSWQAVAFLFFVLDTLVMWTLAAPNISDISNVKEDQCLEGYSVVIFGEAAPSTFISSPSSLCSAHPCVSDSLRGHGWWAWNHEDLMCVKMHLSEKSEMLDLANLPILKEWSGKNKCMNVPWKCVLFQRCLPDALLWCLNLVISPSISFSCHSPKPYCLFLKIKLILSLSHTWLDKMFTCLLLMGLSHCVTAILCPPPFARCISRTKLNLVKDMSSPVPPPSTSLYFHLLITSLTQYRNLYPSLPLSICAASSLILFSTPSCFPFPHMMELTSVIDDSE